MKGLDVGGRMGLKWISEKFVVTLYTGFTWLVADSYKHGNVYSGFIISKQRSLDLLGRTPVNYDNINRGIWLHGQ